MKNYLLPISVLMLFLLMFNNKIIGQKNVFQSGFGLATHLGTSLNGHALDFSYERRLLPRLGLRFTAGYSFANGKGLLNDYPVEDVMIRSIDNTKPFKTASGFSWSKNSFQGISLPTKPDRFFTFDIMLSAHYIVVKKGKNTLLGGLGATWSYCDRMILMEVLEVTYQRFVLDKEPQKGLMPLFSYETFTDIALVPYVEYTRQLNKHIFLGLNTRFPTYLHSKVNVNTTSLLLGFSF